MNDVRAAGRTMASDGFLHRYFMQNGGKRLFKWMHYFDIYERHLERYRGQSPVMIEIGVAAGGSLEMWRSYFGDGTRILGIDIDPACKQHECNGIEVFTGSQDDPAFLDAILEKYPSIDIVLDDGSHIMKHMIASFEYLYPRIDKRGVYIVEDTHTCYWQEWDGGYKREGTFMEFVKDRLDDINALHAKGAFPVTDFTRSTHSISVYDSIVAFEKRPQGIRHSIATEGVPAPGA
jgi:hypothetical protein